MEPRKVDQGQPRERLLRAFWVALPWELSFMAEFYCYRLALSKTLSLPLPYCGMLSVMKSACG